MIEFQPMVSTVYVLLDNKLSVCLINISFYAESKILYRGQGNKKRFQKYQIVTVKCWLIFSNFYDMGLNDYCVLIIIIVMVSLAVPVDIHD